VCYHVVPAPTERGVFSHSDWRVICVLIGFFLNPIYIPHESGDKQSLV